nr:retrovirus-related Pol polyprotein from transposon TNT 1-94 [Tanacetum cinerariifolium]
ANRCWDCWGSSWGVVRMVREAGKRGKRVYRVWREALCCAQCFKCRVTWEVVQILLWIVDSGYSKHMTAIIDCGDYVQGNITVCHVYYVEGLGYKLFSTLTSKLDIINDLIKHDLVDGLAKFKYSKDHLCSAYFDGNTVFVPYDAPNIKEAESSTIALDLSNMHEFHQGYKQKEGIDFMESFALVARLEDVRMFKKALYGLKQAPRAWYDKLSSFLIEQHFTKDFSKRFANLIKNNIELSMMGELKFFLGLQVHQSPRGIFISQSQYAIELLKKHGMDDCVSMSTPMAPERLDADLQGTPTD